MYHATLFSSGETPRGGTLTLGDSFDGPTSLTVRSDHAPRVEDGVGEDVEPGCGHRLAVNPASHVDAVARLDVASAIGGQQVAVARVRTADIGWIADLAVGCGHEHGRRYSWPARRA